MRARSVPFIDKRPVRATIIIMTAALCVVYFFQVTQASARGVVLKHLSAQKSTLTGETYRLDLSIAEESSAHNLQKRVAELGLSSARNIEYVIAGSHSVAIK